MVRTRRFYLCLLFTNTLEILMKLKRNQFYNVGYMIKFYEGEFKDQTKILYMDLEDLEFESLTDWLVYNEYITKEIAENEPYFILDRIVFVDNHDSWIDITKKTPKENGLQCVVLTNKLNYIECEYHTEQEIFYRIDTDSEIGWLDNGENNELITYWKQMPFKPRKFKAKIDEFGLDDIGMSGLTFKVKSLTKNEIYEEMNPSSISGNKRGVVIDDNGCWWHYGDESFNKRFEEI